jgi:mannose-6-phosphate isomerase
MKADGSFEIEPAPTSSLYHIICAIEELSSAKL